MTLYELSLEYAQTAADLRRRIVELEHAGRQAGDEARRMQLEGRARHLERYYEKHSPRQAGPAAAPQRKRRA